MTIYNEYPYTLKALLNDGELVAVKADNIMQTGKMLFGRISSKEWDGTWLKIDIKIYLHE